MAACPICGGRSQRRTIGKYGSCRRCAKPQTRYVPKPQDRAALLAEHARWLADNPDPWRRTWGNGLVLDQRWTKLAGRRRW